MVKTNRFFHASKWNWNFVYVCIVTLPLLFVNTLSNFIHLICTLQEFSFDDSEFNHKFARISISSLSTMPFLLRKFCNLYFLVGMLNKVSCKRIMTFTKKYGFSLIYWTCDDKPTYHMCHWQWLTVLLRWWKILLFVEAP